MEDSLSVKSNDSIATSDEYEFIGGKPGANNKTPTLNIINGDINDLQREISHALTDYFGETAEMEHFSAGKKIGSSTFYSCVEPGTDPLSAPLELHDSSPDEEKQDSVKHDSEEDDVDQYGTTFAGVTYLGAATINAPKSEGEIQRNMAILNEQSAELGIKVSVSVPCSSQGFVVLYDAISSSVMYRFEIHRILFYARGAIESTEAGCFAFTWSHGDTQESAIFQCHIFRCDIAEAVSRVSACFAKAFQRVPRSMSSSVTSALDMAGSIAAVVPAEARTLMYVFEVSLEIKEDDGKGAFSVVAKDKGGFKLKMNVEKQLCLSIKQVSDNGPQLSIDRCFGVLIAPGQHVRHSDMQLLEMKEQSNASFEKNCTLISAMWDPTEPSFESLNVETPKDVRQFMTVAVDLVIRGIQEPVRFQIETPVKIFGQNERNFWYFHRRTLIQQFFLNLKEVVTTGDLSDTHYEVLNMETSGELDRNLLNLNLNLSSLIQSPSITSIDTITPKDEYNSDGDEPLLSGTGLVSKDCAEDVLENWADVLTRWKSTKQLPKQLTSLVRLGIPEALRGEVWQRLAGVEEDTVMMENYRLLIVKESSCENVIQRDIARTFPAHDFFKEAGGLGQDSLYRVSKAYAAYDSEVGYCQGLSFLAATLLLHMPEEQAFCVLVKLMYNYGLRDLYKDGFDNLYLRLYQLNRLMEEQLGPLWQHFTAHHIETHMFASQWFLTLFTARFPLYFVFHIIDVFLLQGIDTLFQVALALLMMCKKDLLLLDFEGILKYFRVSLPKKCRTEESAKNLIKLACSIKVKKLKKYEADFIALKDGWEIIMLDSEAADNAESEANETERINMRLARYEEERQLFLDELTKVKSLFKREVERAEREKAKYLGIIDGYKTDVQKLEAQLFTVQAEWKAIKAKVSTCEQCSGYVKDSNLAESNSDDGLERLKQLEKELIDAKLAYVQAQCRNEALTHQLRATETELSTTKSSWTPWLSKTLNSIKEVANKKESSTYPQSNIPTSTPSFVSHVKSVGRRDSVPLRKDRKNKIKEQRRESTTPIIKDSQSCSSLRDKTTDLRSTIY